MRFLLNSTLLKDIIEVRNGSENMNTNKIILSNNLNNLLKKNKVTKPGLAAKLNSFIEKSQSFYLDYGLKAIQ